MAPMPRPRPPHLHVETTRHGRQVWYVRVGHGSRIRIREPYGSDGFWAAYRAAVEGQPSAGRPPAASSLAWLVARYRDSAAWLALSAATRRQRENILRHVLESAGEAPYARISGKTIQAGIDRRRATPAQARHFVDTMRGLFRWAMAADLVAADPTAGRAVAKPKTKGFPVWTDDEIAAFERRWPRGTRERVMFDIFLYTGLRRGDAARLGRPHVRAGVITIDTEKTDTRVSIPMLPELAATLAAGPVGELTFIAGRDGRPLRKEVIGTLFRLACRAAGIDKSAHGLRKAAATRAANAGATVAQLEAIFGWEGGRMASLYTRSADRQALAAAAIEKLSRTSAPAPDGRCGTGKKN
ncbi:MAG: tyrosine-type recombinase/integrase [Pseudomonadota bacterium]